MFENKQKPTISVLMPLYNADKFVSVAIESVLQQTFTDFELIIYNDGSTDDSGVIAEKYRALDERVKVYHFENSGAANARNELLNLASGEYITFIDSDDQYLSDYLESLYELVVKNNADLSFCLHLECNADDSSRSYFVLDNYNEIYHYTGVELCKKLYSLENAFLHHAITPCGKLYKRELWKNVEFPAGKLHEDAYTIYKVFLMAEKIVYINTPLYVYRVREDSISHKKISRKGIHDFVEQEEERIALLTVAGIELPSNYGDYYIDSLRKLSKAALDNGFIDEYKWLKVKLEVLDTMAARGYSMK